MYSDIEIHSFYILWSVDVIFYYKFRLLICRSDVKPTAVALHSAFLLLEKSKGDKSYWYYYIQSAPSSYSTLLHIHSDDDELLDEDLRDQCEAVKCRLQRSVDAGGVFIYYYKYILFIIIYLLFIYLWPLFGSTICLLTG